MADTDLTLYDPAKDPDFDPSKFEVITVPDWLLSHPDLVSRGIVLVAPLKSVCAILRLVVVYLISNAPTS